MYTLPDESFNQCEDSLSICFSILKMLYLIGPDGLVNLDFENVQKMVWMTMVHVLRLGSSTESSLKLFTRELPLIQVSNAGVHFYESVHQDKKPNLQYNSLENITPCKI